MSLPNVAKGDPHVQAHNEERQLISKLQDLSDPEFQSELSATIATEITDQVAVAVDNGAPAPGNGLSTVLGPASERNGSAIASDVGTSVIINPGAANGYNNVIGGDGSTTIGTNAPNATTPGTGAHVSVVGGFDNVAGGLSSKIISDHSHTKIGSTHGAIYGGAYNVIGPASDFSFIAGAYNTVNGDHSTATGRGNTVHGANASADGFSNTIAAGAPGGSASGNTNIVNGAYGRAHGQECQVDLQYGRALGQYARSRFAGQEARASGRFAAQGDAQASRIVLHRQTTDATTVTVGWGAGSTSYQLQPNQSAAFEFLVVARAVGTADTAAWKITGCYSRGATGTPTAIGTPTVTALGASAGAATWTAVLTTDSAGGINVRATGEAAKTIRWVANFTASEVTV